MSSASVVARRELLDLRRNRFLLSLLGFVLFAALVSVVVAASQFRVTLDEYNAYVEALRLSGNTATPAAPKLFSLQLLRGSLEYLEILGALFAIVMGYGMIAKEKQRATLQLIFTRPIGRYSLAAGKVVALSVAWLITVVVIFAAVSVALVVIGGASLSVIDIQRLLITMAAAWGYLLLWSAIAMGLAASTKRLSTGLIFAMVLWLAVVLVLPQVGDTMDPDNQVPGGLFQSLQIAKPDEKAVLAHFASFDTARNALEVASVTKHYERLSFAYLGIKDQYNQQSLRTVWDGTVPNFWTLLLAVILGAAFAVLSTTRTTLLRRKL